VGEDNLSDEDASLVEALAIYDRQAEEHSDEEDSGDSGDEVRCEVFILYVWCISIVSCIIVSDC
jgi:hypothetical protein